MTEGITTGWQHATFAIGWLLGALPTLALIAVLAYGAPWAIDAARHQHRVHRLRRQARREGRRAGLPIGNG